MAKIAFPAPFFEVDLADIQIIELYSYGLYNELEEERLLALSTLIVTNALIKLCRPSLLP